MYCPASPPTFLSFWQGRRLIWLRLEAACHRPGELIVYRGDLVGPRPQLAPARHVALLRFEPGGPRTIDFGSGAITSISRPDGRHGLRMLTDR